MNTQEAKFILQAYRPGGEDAGDPQFAEALAQAKLDPELAKWFAEQLAFDAAATRAIKEVKAPQHLRDSILAGRRVIEPKIWSRQPVVWAMAAAILILLGIAGFWVKSRRDWTQFASYRAEMTRAAEAHGKHVELESPDPAKIHAWLANQEVDPNYVLPARLSGAAAMGCRVVNWDGHKAYMICYWMQGTNHMDLFVAEKRDFKGAFPGDKPQFATTEGRATASWSYDAKVYLLVGQGPVDEKFLRQHLEPQGVAGVQSGQEWVSACQSLIQFRAGSQNTQNLAGNFF
ncbi:MAG TPA: hypothetical protein VFC07_08140 [Verrucomicrobiae bacterium]|nr:hypothetical protein [Verrucomicrobiae bacterium]